MARWPEATQHIRELEAAIAAARAWNDVAIESNKAIEAYLREVAPDVDSGGMLVDHMRRVVATMRRDAERLSFLEDCVMNHGGIDADRDWDAYADSPTHGFLPTVSLFTVPSQWVRGGIGFRGAIDVAMAKVRGQRREVGQP